MNETRQLLFDTVTELFAERCGVDTLEAAKKDGWSPTLWRTLEQSDFHLIAVPESIGGAGGDLGDAAVLLRAAGLAGAPVPLAETGLLAGWLLASAGLAVPKGPLTVAPVVAGEKFTLSKKNGRFTVSGEGRHVPYGRIAGRIIALARNVEAGCDMVIVLDPGAAVITPGANLAGEPRDHLRFSDVPVDANDIGLAGGIDGDGVRLRGALARAIMMSGALERVLALSIQYATEREQFGRPIGRFQAIQHYIALVAAEVVATKSAVNHAVAAAETPTAEFAIAAAKTRAGQAAGVASALAHQVHGAIGFTEEHQLHYFTTRLWAWRDEFGNEGEWARRLGRVVLRNGADALWPSLTANVHTGER